MIRVRLLDSETLALDGDEVVESDECFYLWGSDPLGARVMTAVVPKANVVAVVPVLPSPTPPPAANVSRH